MNLADDTSGGNIYLNYRSSTGAALKNRITGYLFWNGQSSSGRVVGQLVSTSSLDEGAFWTGTD